MIRISFLLAVSLFCFNCIFSQIIIEDTENGERIVHKSERVKKKIYEPKYGIRAVRYENNKYGFMDEDLNVIIPAIYDGFTSIYRDRIVVRKGGLSGVINFKNEVIVPFKYYHFHRKDGISRINSDSYKVWISNRCGIINLDGELMIPVEYEFVHLNDNRFYEVHKDGKRGVIDLAGNMILEPVYSSLNHYLNNLFICNFNESYTMIDISTGDKLFKDTYLKLKPTHLYPSANNKLFFARKGLKHGLINSSEEIIIPFDYDEISQFNSRFYKIKKDGKIGIYDVLQKIELQSPKYDEIKFNNSSNAISCFSVKLNEKYGISYIGNNQLISLLPIEYDDIRSEVRTYDYIITKDGKKGLFNLALGKIVVPLIYDGKVPFTGEDGYYIFFKDKERIAISALNYKPLINRSYRSIKEEKGFFICYSNNGLIHLYDLSGNEYINGLEDLTILNYNFIKIRKEAKWGIYSAALNKIIIPCKHQQVSYSKDVFQIDGEKYKIYGSKLIRID